MVATQEGHASPRVGKCGGHCLYSVQGEILSLVLPKDNAGSQGPRAYGLSLGQHVSGPVCNQVSSTIQICSVLDSGQGEESSKI